MLFRSQAIVDWVSERVAPFKKIRRVEVVGEIEEHLAKLPEVRLCCVVGIADDYMGEVPKAFVVSDGTLSEEDVVSFVAERVSPQKRVRRVEFVDAIPKSPSGKILRRVLIDRELAHEEGHS